MRRIRTSLKNESLDGMSLTLENRVEVLTEIATTKGLIVHDRLGVTQWQEVGSSEIHSVNPHDDLEELFSKYELILMLKYDYKEKLERIILGTWKEK